SIVLFTHNTHSIDSIAVLPFANKSDDSETQLLIDAITDRIINNLLKLPDLKVKRGNIGLKSNGAENDPVKIGQGLDVHAVLNGNISKRGENLTINVELVDARDNTILWSEIYSRKISDLLLIQQEISRDVSDKLRLKLSGEEKKRQEADQLY